MGIQINGQTDTISAVDGSITVATDLTVPGALTYDDVTNIDSVGVITARSGLHVTSGNVGIGTDNPICKLVVNSGTTNLATQIVSDDAEVFLAFKDGDSTGNQQVQIGGVGNNFVAYAGGNEKLRIDSAGRLLVGATSSYGSANSDDLTIGDRTQSEVGITLGATVASAIRFADANNVSAGMIQYVHNSGGTDYLNFYTNGANERLRITSTGNIGINDQNPGEKLSISGGNLGIYHTGNNHGNVYFYKDGTAKGWVKYRGNDEKLVIGNVTDAINVKTSGNVGVGNADPTQAKFVAQTSSGMSIAAIKDNTGASISLGGVTQPRILIEAGATASEFKMYTAGGSSYGSASWTERFRIHSSGVPQFTTTGTHYASAAVPAFVVNSNGDHALVLNNQNTTDPRGLFIYQNQDVNNGTSYFWRARAGGTDRAHLYSNGTLELHSGNLKVASGNGIDFSTTANSSGSMSSELLDDYEEGSWTPNFSNCSYTPTVQFGRYTKIGRYVYCTITIDGNSMSGSGTIGLEGLPFAADNANDNGQRSSWHPANGGHMVGLSINDARFRVDGSTMQGVKGATGNTSYMSGSQLTSGTFQFTGDFSYYTAS